MKEYIISAYDAGTRLDKFIAKLLKDGKTNEVYKSLRKKKVRVNGSHRDGSFRLSENDRVCLYINDELFKAEDNDFPWIDISPSVNIVYEDENILIAHKPSGLLSQGDGDCLENRVRSYLYRKGEIKAHAFIPSLCHRIDRNTSGLLIAAKSSEALRILNQKIKNREIRKLYLCETENVPTPEKGILSGYLKKDEKLRKMIFYPEKQKDALLCKTIYKTIKKSSTVLVEAELLTGRTHQIRACLSYLGAPLTGDVKYGATPDGKREFQHLTAYKLIFDFKGDNGCLDYLSKKTFEAKPL